MGGAQLDGPLEFELTVIHQVFKKIHQVFKKPRYDDASSTAQSARAANVASQGGNLTVRMAAWARA